MSNGNTDYFTKRHSDIPGRPNLLSGRAAQDHAMHAIALSRLPSRARFIVVPQQNKSLDDIDPETLSESDARRLEIGKVAISFLREKKAVDESTAIPAKDLSVKLNCKLKAVSNFLSLAMNEGLIIKVRKSLNPKRPSENCAHYYLGKNLQ